MAALTEQTELVEILIRLKDGAFVEAHAIEDETVRNDGAVIMRKPGKARVIAAADVDAFLAGAGTAAQISALVAERDDLVLTLEAAALRVEALESENAALKGGA